MCHLDFILLTAVKSYQIVTASIVMEKSKRGEREGSHLSNFKTNI